MFDEILLLHSITRIVVLLAIIIAIIKSYIGWFWKKEFTKTDGRITLITAIIIHLQFFSGLILYFTSPTVKIGLENMGNAMKNPDLRFWTVEHIGMMIVAIALITLGKVLSKKTSTDIGKHKRIALFYTIGLILIFMAIP